MLVDRNIREARKILRVRLQEFLQLKLGPWDERRHDAAGRRGVIAGDRVVWRWRRRRRRFVLVQSWFLDRDHELGRGFGFGCPGWRHRRRKRLGAWCKGLGWRHGLATKQRATRAKVKVSCANIKSTPMYPRPDLALGLAQTSAHTSSSIHPQTKGEGLVNDFFGKGDLRP